MSSLVGKQSDLSAPLSWFNLKSHNKKTSKTSSGCSSRCWCLGAFLLLIIIINILRKEWIPRFNKLFKADRCIFGSRSFILFIFKSSFSLSKESPKTTTHTALNVSFEKEREREEEGTLKINIITGSAVKSCKSPTLTFIQRVQLHTLSRYVVHEYRGLYCLPVHRGNEFKICSHTSSIA